jgi:hypothetical protein
MTGETPVALNAPVSFRLPVTREIIERLRDEILLTKTRTRGAAVALGNADNASKAHGGAGCLLCENQDFCSRGFGPKIGEF